MSVKSHRTNRIIFIAVGLIAALLFLATKASQGPTTEGSFGEATAVVYRTANCGCCANYISYLRRAGMVVEEKLVEDIAPIKDEFGVPAELTSCHTTRIGDYTVEGHVPIEAIQKLLSEKPAIAGIGLPGMPSGSPGMPGAKYESFDISSFTTDGTVSLYMSI